MLSMARSMNAIDSNRKTGLSDRKEIMTTTKSNLNEVPRSDGDASVDVDK